MKLIARLTFYYQGRSSWRPARFVVEDLKKLGYPGLTVAGVVACQRVAWERGFIDIVYRDPDEQAEVERLELALLDRFASQGLRRVLLVPGDQRMRANLPKSELKAIHQHVTLLMAERAAAYLAEVLATAAHRHPPGRLFRIAVARGYTLYEFARALRHRSPRELPELIKVLPMVAIGDVQRQYPVEANMNASEVATTLGGVSGQLACPAVVHRSRYALFAADEQVKPVLEELAQTDVVVSGFGGIAFADDASDVVLTTDPQRNRELFRPARLAGAVGEVCCQWYSSSGEPVETDIQAIGLDLPTLKRIARDEEKTGRTVIMIGGGDRRRIPALEAAIQGRFMGALVTDTITARVLLKELPA